MHADTNAKQPIAIVIPHELHLRHVLQSSNIGVDHTLGLADLCHNPKVASLVLKECNSVGKKNGFKPMELLQSVILTPDEWTPESGLVTAAQKIQRGKIAKAFEAEIKVRVLSLRFPPTHGSDCWASLPGGVQGSVN